MPATSPRLSITLDQETHTALVRLSEVQRRPIATIVREFLDTAAPTIDHIAASMEAMREAQDAAKAGLAGTLGEVVEELEPHLMGIMGHLQAMANLSEAGPVVEVGSRKGVTPLAAVEAVEPPFPGFQQQDGPGPSPSAEGRGRGRPGPGNRGEGVEPLRQHGAKRPHAKQSRSAPLTPGL